MNEPNEKQLIKMICDNLGEDLDKLKADEIKLVVKSSDKCLKLIKSLDLTVECYKKYNVEVTEDMHKRLMDFLGLEESK
ncbi:MAG: hypothetical protein V1720_05925 [bacterium]